jgi:RNA polymerase sigma factor (sigma-70 family)
MNENDWLARRFDDCRARLISAAYQMLGSATEAEEAVEEARARLVHLDDEIEQLTRWLTTIVIRVCLQRLRSRVRSTGAHGVRDPAVGSQRIPVPGHERLVADSVGLALLAILETLPVPERSVLLLHGLFGLPIDEIAPMVGRTPTKTRELVGRARRRMAGSAVHTSDRDFARQRQVVDAFVLAGRAGDLDALIALLDPDVVLRTDTGRKSGGSTTIRGAEAVARRARQSASPAARLHPARVNGTAGIVVALEGRPLSILSFTIAAGKIVEIVALSDPVRVERAAAALLNGN